MEIASLAVPFEFAHVEKFPARRPSLDAIRNFFFNLKMKGDVSVTILNKHNVLIKLFNDLDYCRVFAHRSYFVNNCFMKLIKWSPTLDVEIESPVVPIWIYFPNLRPHLFASRILHGLGRIFGNPLKIDNATSTGSRPSVARVLVEIDVSKKFHDKIWVGSKNSGYVQSVVFEDFQDYCVHCSSLGHSKAGCTILHPNLIPSSALGEAGNVVAPSVPLVLTVIDGSSPICSPCNNLISRENVVGCENANIAIGMAVLPSVESPSVSPVASPVLGVVEDFGRPLDSVRNVEPKVYRQLVNSDVQGILDNSQNLVNVPVTVGGTSGLDVKSHGDWLHNSSDYNYDSESYSDPDNEFKMVRDGPLKAVSRGKF
ncbi:hypothetical protein MA16_Dca005493 [Dendrobium catenatum]|uniref:DUF4283 domain-containing protein n=1 Tax=Dendrobium catenatum TaxID=906689 RepID=A0A2I0X3J1_9ASPA|nr:hypothetical protein MA16_Dca005493 [Dendrobium catenatum]